MRRWRHGARVQALLDDPAQLDALRRKLACLRQADIDVAALLFADVRPARPDWAGRLPWLPVLLVGAGGGVAGAAAT